VNCEKLVFSLRDSVRQPPGSKPRLKTYVFEISSNIAQPVCLQVFFASHGPLGVWGGNCSAVPSHCRPISYVSSVFTSFSAGYSFRLLWEWTCRLVRSENGSVWYIQLFIFVSYVFPYYVLLMASVTMVSVAQNIYRRRQNY
jgi:hypothetical protein